MIHLYTGKTGSGKTYCMIKDVYKHWRKGVDIYSNTKLEFEKFGGKAGSNIIDNPKNFAIYEHIIDITLNLFYKYILKKQKKLRRRGNIVYYEDITELIEVRDGIIVMDEAQNLLEARNWENLPPEFSNKLRQHRKHKLDFYGTAQNLGTIDINLRRLVQKWSHCRDVFALLTIRNPNIFTIHIREYKDIDYLYNQVDDLQVPALKEKLFIIHFFKRRLYDTMYDIGFNAYKIVWVMKSNKKKALIIPKTMNLNSARTLLLSTKYYLDQTK